MPKTQYLATIVLNQVLRALPFASPAATYIALFTTAPTPTSMGIEVSGGSYTRQPATFAAPASQQTSNSADVAFPIATAPWGSLVAFAVMDAPTGGNMLYFAPFSTPRDIVVNDQARFPAGQLLIQEA
jgi:hypothetical protein